MEKDKKTQISETIQMSLEFSNKPIIKQNPSQTSPENSKIISLSDYKIQDKGKTDYTNLVLKFTKSF
ncbi:hypothetical protein [Flavobacterium sp. 5]|uniref:hypothetical protein n=1 Tax=Flavobacterium sp. 5 TaxID=2035199 RepID=UPI000C2C7BA6|nr:hypothetical protein [Flavobacterium sp. 5]PKB16486.1 hypothetical protein CLU82_1623 [Flavobacterium sp. 5]